MNIINARVLAIALLLTVIASLFLSSSIFAQSNENQPLLRDQKENNETYENLLLEILKKTDSPLIAFCIIVFVLNIRYGFLDKILKSKNGDNPHVSIDTYLKDKSDISVKLDKIIEKQGYHSTEIKLINDKIELIRNEDIKDSATVLSVRDSMRDLIQFHKAHHPDDDIEKPI